MVINRDTLKLVLGMARHGAPDVDSLAVVNSMAVALNALLDAIENGAKAQAQAQAEKQAATQPPADLSRREPKQEPAVVEHGINSVQAQAKRDVRRARRLAEEVAKKGGGPQGAETVDTN